MELDEIVYRNKKLGGWEAKLPDFVEKELKMESGYASPIVRNSMSTLNRIKLFFREIYGPYSLLKY